MGGPYDELPKEEENKSSFTDEYAQYRKVPH